MQRASVSRMGVQDFELTYLNTVSVSIAFFILKIYFGVEIGVSFSWWNLESLSLLDGKVDPGDFSHRCIG